VVTPASSSRRFLAPGDKLGKYEVIRQIAVGGMAELYLVRTVAIEGFEKLACVKRILPQYINNPSFVTMFLNEARLAATLHHPNIAQVYDIGQEAGEYFFSMEYVHGEDLGRLVATSRENGVPIALECALTLVAGLCAGLHHAHDKPSPDGKALGVVHRDVSPANVLVSYDGAIKLVDFGIARAGGAPSTSSTGLKGKIAYMSPEQGRGRGALDRRSDVFSIGTILYELTTGRLPFVDETEYGVLHQIVNTDAAPPSSIVASYPAALEAIVMKALARDVDQRYATALELQSQLEDFAHDHRLRVSPLVVARLMSTLFPARLEEWEHARAQGAFFVEQHVVRTLIESGKAADVDPAAATPAGAPGEVSAGEARGSPVTAVASPGADAFGRPVTHAQPTLRGIPRVAPALPGLPGLPRLPTPRPVTDEDSAELTTVATPPRAGASANANPTLRGVRSAGSTDDAREPTAASSPARAPGGMASPAQRPGGAALAPTPSVPSPGGASPSEVGVAPASLAAGPSSGIRPPPRSGQPRPSPVPNQPGAVPIIQQLGAPMIPSGGTLVSSATLAGTLPPAVLPSQTSPSGLAGFAGQNLRSTGQGPAMPYVALPGMIGVPGMSGALGDPSMMPASSSSSSSGGYGAAAVPPSTLSGVDSLGGHDVEREAAMARARANAHPTMVLRIARPSRLPLIALTVIVASGAAVAGWLVLGRDGAASQPATAVPSSTPAPDRATAQPATARPGADDQGPAAVTGSAAAEPAVTAAEPAVTGNAATVPAAASNAATVSAAAGDAATVPAVTGNAATVPAAASNAATVPAAASNAATVPAAASNAATVPAAASNAATVPAAAGNAATVPAAAVNAAAKATPERTVVNRAPAEGAAPVAAVPRTGNPASGSVPGAATPEPASNAPASRGDAALVKKPTPNKPTRPRTRRPRAETKEQTWDDDSPFMPVATPKR
jgi:eukaryotic-like serine/threonine-protein kinase